MAQNDRIKSAIADLESQERPNISATAQKWKIARTTLSDHYKGKSTSITLDTRRKLSAIQEKTLVTYINKLSARGLPPTP